MVHRLSTYDVAPQCYQLNKTLTQNSIFSGHFFQKFDCIDFFELTFISILFTIISSQWTVGFSRGQNPLLSYLQRMKERSNIAPRPFSRPNRFSESQLFIFYFFPSKVGHLCSINQVLHSNPFFLIHTCPQFFKINKKLFSFFF